MKFCSNCGCENIDEAQFCRNCGLELKSEVAKGNENVVENQVVASDSIIAKLFYKTDKHTGELRMARSKTISIIVFAAMFIFGVAIHLSTISIFVVFVSVIFALIFAVPIYILGYIVGWAMDKLNN